MAKHNQGGWVATFLIVGTILLLGVLGGVYYIRTHNQQNQSETADSGMNEMNRNESSSDSEQENKTEEKPAATDEKTKSESSSSANTGTANQTPSSIPATGPTDTLYALLVVTALTFSAVHFVNSRKAHAKQF